MGHIIRRRMVSDLHKFRAEDLTLKSRAYQSQSDVERRTTLEMRRCCLALGYDAGIESLGWNARSNWQEERGRNQYGNCIDGPHMFVSDGGNTMQNARVFKFPALAIWCFDLCFGAIGHQPSEVDCPQQGSGFTPPSGPPVAASP